MGQRPALERRRGGGGLSTSGVPGREPVSPWPFGSLVALTGVLFLYGVAFGRLPWWAATLLLVFWVAMLVLALRWFRTRPRATVVAPLLATAAWFAAVVGGARWFGWS